MSNEFSPEKIYHEAKHIGPNGEVSPLCRKNRPKAIDLGKEMWTTDPKAVTCEKCKRAREGVGL